MSESFEPSALVAQADGKGFFRSLAGEDDLGVIIRAAIYIEHELDEYAKMVLVQHEEMGQLNFSTRRKLALACGLRKDLKEPLRLIGNLRNSFAHKLDTKITEKFVREFVSSFVDIDQEVLRRVYESHSDEGELPSSFESVSPRDQLILCLTVLWAALINERRLLADHRRQGV